MKRIILILLLVLPTLTFGQRRQRIDSLVNLAQDTTQIAQVPIYILLSRIYFPISRDTCGIYADKAVEVSQKVGDNKSIALALTHLAYYNERIQEYNYAFAKIEEALKFAEMANDSNTIAKVHDRWAHMHYQKEEIASTLEHYKTAIKYSKGNYSLDGYARLVINTATLTSRIGDYDVALEYYSKVLHMISRGDSLSARVEGQLYNAMGNYYSTLKKNDEAESYMLKAYEIKKQTRQVNGQIVALGNLSTVYKNTNRYDQAEEILLRAHQLADSAQSIRYLPELSIMVGTLYQEMDRYNEAEVYFRKGIKMASENGFSSALSEGYLNLSQLNVLRNRLTEAQLFMDRSLELGRVNPNKDLMMNIYRVKTSLDSMKNDFQNALTSHMIYLTYKDSLLNESKLQSIANNEVKFKTAKKDSEIRLLTKDNELKAIRTTQLTQLRNGLIIGSIMLILLAAFIYWGYFNKKKSLVVIKKQKQAIQEKSDENELLIKEVHHRVKNNLQIILSLLNTQTNMLKEDDKAIQIIGESQNRIKSLALIHQDLYQSNNLVKVSAKNYFENLLNNIQNTYKNVSEEIVIKSEVDDISLKMELAVPLGLILNELVTNSFKYAFKGMESGYIFVQLTNESETGRYRLKVMDNGKGISQSFYTDELDSFGIDLVKGLTDQLGGTIDIKTDDGTEFDIAISDIEEAA